MTALAVGMMPPPPTPWMARPSRMTANDGASAMTSAGSQPAANPGERLAIVCAVMVGFALTSNFAYALAGSLLRGWLAQGRRLLVFNRVMAAVLLATAVWLIGA